MRHLIRSLALSASLLVPVTATAAPLSFGAPDAEAGRIAASVVPGLEGAVAVRVDLGRGAPDILAREAGDCEPSCRHVGLAWYSDDWHVTFDVPATTVEIGGKGYGGYRRLVVDGTIDMQWRLDGYAPSASGNLRTEPVEGAAARAMAVRFGEGALELYDAGRIVVEASTIDPTGGVVPDVWYVTIKGGGTCAREIGCPFRILAVRDGSWMTLAEGHGDGVRTIDAVRAGWADIVASRPVGFGRYGWTSKGYVAVEGGS